MNFKHYSIVDKKLWIDDLMNTLDIIQQSADIRRNNYSSKNFILDDYPDVSIIYLDKKLIAFSVIQQKNIWPQKYLRILSRSWKSPEIRWHRAESYYILSKLMVDHQINVAKKLNSNGVFISSEGRRKKWLRNWVRGANNDGHNFLQIDGMVKVCNGAKINCWQNVAYVDFRNNVPNFDVMSYDDWENEIK